jgi:hypothetical protein
MSDALIGNDGLSVTPIGARTVSLIIVVRDLFNGMGSRADIASAFSPDAFA